MSEPRLDTSPPSFTVRGPACCPGGGAPGLEIRPDASCCGALGGPPEGERLGNSAEGGDDGCFSSSERLLRTSRNGV